MARIPPQLLTQSLQSSAALAADQHAALLLGGYHPTPTGDALLQESITEAGVVRARIPASDNLATHEPQQPSAIYRLAAFVVTRLGPGLILPLVLLAFWQLSAIYGWLPDQILPAPALILDVLQERISDGSLWDDTSISLLRVLRGFTLGAGIGLALGGALAASPRLHDYLNPLFLAVSQVPILGWVPLLILVIGIDEGLKNSLVALSVFIPVTLGTYQGIRDVPFAYREVGQVLTFSRLQSLTTIILPAAVPAIFTGLREGLSNGWQTLVAVELLASTEGLGFQMAYGRQLFQLELVIAAMLVIGLIGFAFDFLLGRIETHLQRWQVVA